MVWSLTPVIGSTTMSIIGTYIRYYDGYNFKNACIIFFHSPVAQIYRFTCRKYFVFDIVGMRVYNIILWAFDKSHISYEYYARSLQIVRYTRL